MVNKNPILIKKILLCESIDNSSYILPILNALKIQGFQVKIFDIEKGSLFTRSIGLLNNLLQIKSKLINIIISKSKQIHLIYLVDIWKPQLLLVIKGHEIDKETIQKINKRGVVTINWYPDWLIFWDWIKINAPYYKYFISLCINLTNKLKKIHSNAFYLPFATEPTKSISFINRKYNLTFVGQYTPRREKFLRVISDLGLEVWGYSSWHTSSLKSIYHLPLSIQGTIDILRQSKISVNILSGSDKFQPLGLNNRTLEVMGCGALLIVHKDKIITKYFKDKKDLIIFTSPEDLRRKVIYYLKHDKERERIAKSGWEKVRKYHTYDIRLKELFKKINIITK